MAENENRAQANHLMLRESLRLEILLGDPSRERAEAWYEARASALKFINEHIDVVLDALHPLKKR